MYCTHNKLDAESIDSFYHFFSEYFQLGSYCKFYRNASGRGTNVNNPIGFCQVKDKIINISHKKI